MDVLSLPASMWKTGSKIKSLSFGQIFSIKNEDAMTVCERPTFSPL